jgi:hypothetical protein
MSKENSKQLDDCAAPFPLDLVDRWPPKTVAGGMEKIHSSMEESLTTASSRNHFSEAIDEDARCGLKAMALDEYTNRFF